MRHTRVCISLRLSYRQYRLPAGGAHKRPSDAANTRGEYIAILLEHTSKHLLVTYTQRHFRNGSLPL